MAGGPNDAIGQNFYVNLPPCQPDFALLFEYSVMNGDVVTP